MPRGKTQASRRLIDECARILQEIQPATVRAVCYRLFVRGLIPDMSKNSTNRVSRQLTDAREAGLIDWDWIVDETREAERPGTWDDPLAFARAVIQSYRRDRWQQQPRRVEVWSEKGTVRGTLAPVLDEYAVTFRVLHGYSSATTVHEVARETREMSRPLIVFYVGDWDPSGLHMSVVDLPARLAEYGARVELYRIAIDAYDISRSDVPSFAAAEKRSDPRFGWYMQHYGSGTGGRCWELDALNPVILRERVADNIEALIDWDAWERCGAVESVEHQSLVDVLSTWKALKQ
jgi:hypothetical protein